MEAAARYDDPVRARRYGKRIGTTRAERRILVSMLAGCAAGRTVLDVPCGNGRLTPFLATLRPARILGADGAFAMARAARGAEAMVAAASRLPLPDASVDVALCMRLLHHVSEREPRRAILAELARVSRGAVAVSFYSAATLEGLRRRFRPKRPSTRRGLLRAEIRADLDAAGLDTVRFRSLLPFVREQTLVLCRVRRPFTPRSCSARRMEDARLCLSRRVTP